MSEEGGESGYSMSFIVKIAIGILALIIIFMILKSALSTVNIQ